VPTLKEKEWAEKYFSWWLRALGCTPTNNAYIYKKKQKEDTDCEVKSHTPYRSVSLTIYPRFWENPKMRREQILVHEAVHVAHAPVSRNRMMDESIYNDFDEGFTDMLSIVLHDMI